MCLLVSEILFFSAKSKRRPSLIYSMQIIPVCLYIVVRRKGVSATRRGGLNWTPISLLVGHPCKLFHSHEPHDDAPAPDVEFRLPDDIETDKGRREEVYKDILEILDHKGYNKETASAIADTIVSINSHSVKELHMGLSKTIMSIAAKKGSV